MSAVRKIQEFEEKVNMIYGGDKQSILIYIVKLLSEYPDLDVETFINRVGDDINQNPQLFANMQGNTP